MTESKTLLLSYQGFQTKHRENNFGCYFIALYIFTQKLIHIKCPTLLKGTSKNAVIRSPVWSTVKKHPAFCSLSLRSSVWVSVWWREMGRDEWSCRGVSLVLCKGTGASRDWTLSSGVTRRAGLWAHQECSRLISCKGALDPLKEKQMSL